MALKLSSRMRWARVRQYLESAQEIRVNFSGHHNTYYSAYKYVTKEDPEFILSENHPNLQEPPTTENAMAAKKGKGGCMRAVRLVKVWTGSRAPCIVPASIEIRPHVCV